MNFNEYKDHELNANKTRSVEIDDYFFDYNEICLSEKSVSWSVLPDRFPCTTWDGKDAFYSAEKHANNYLVPIGFYELEEWGVWSNTSSPSLILPISIQGEVILEMVVRGFGVNVGKQISVTIGTDVRSFGLVADATKVVLAFNVQSPNRVIQFGNIVALPNEISEDSRSLGIGVHSILLTQTPIAVDPWDGLPVSLATAFGTDPEMHLVGFYPPETWGAWSETTNPVVILPFALHGRIALDLEIVGYGPNVGRTIFVQMGDQQVEIVLSASAQVVTLEFNLQEPSRMISFRDVIAESLTGAADPRTMGIGLSNVKVAKSTAIRSWRKKLLSLRENLPDIEKLDISMDGASIVDPHTLELKGIVYVAFLTTTVDSSEWKDVVTAFCWACKERSTVTIVLQITGAPVPVIFTEFAYLMSKIGSVKCRVVLIPAHFTYETSCQLLELADYYVHVPSSKSPDTFGNIFKTTPISKIVSTDENMDEYFSKDSTSYVPPRVRPKKAKGHKFRLELELETTIDWGNLADAFYSSQEKDHTLNKENRNVLDHQQN